MAGLLDVHSTSVRSTLRVVPRETRVENRPSALPVASQTPPDPEAIEMPVPESPASSDAGYFQVRPLRDIDLASASNAAVPASGTLAMPAKSIPPGSSGDSVPIPNVLWPPMRPGYVTCFQHRPLYFEEPNLERYGYSCGILQPAASTAKFYCNVVALPYKMAVDPPCSCVSTCRYPCPPGTCAPPVRECPPCDCLGAAAEVGTIAGLILLVP
jgi:hypothetical protein